MGSFNHHPSAHPGSASIAAAWKVLMVVMLAMAMALASTPGKASADGVTIPGAPTNVTAVASDGVATVWFTAPSSNGGSAITGYTVTAVDTTTPANGGQSCAASDPSDSCVVLNLTDSDQYTFQVVTTNAVGSSSPSSSNTVVPAVVTVTQVSSGAYGPSTCARLSNGTADCWGLNSTGQLGNATTTPSSTPVQVVGVGGVGLLTGVASVTVGSNHACAVLDSGAVDCWGDNSSGQLGTNSNTSSNVPVQVFAVGSTSSASLLAGVTSVSAGQYGTCAMLSVGGVDCWGSNANGQLGNNSNTDSWTPVQVFAVGSTSASALLGGVASLSMGYYHACALLSSGAVDCWGYNSFGQLGDNSLLNRSTPVQVMGAGGVGLLSGVTSVSTGDVHTCVSLSGGGAECWGYDNWGQLGNGSTASSSTLTPTPVVGVGGAGFLADVATIASAASHNCAVLVTGAVDCWGQGNSGQIGNNATSNSNTPVQVFAIGSVSAASLLAGVTSASLGDNFACALSAVGTVACWGNGAFGRLGSGAQTSSSTPVAIVAASPTAPSVRSLGSQTATIGWTASAGGVWYQVTATDVTTPVNGGQTCAKTSTTSCTVTGLTNGDTYTFSVAAYNGLLRATSVPTTPIAIANAPTGDPSAAAYDRAAMVSFATALPIGSYTATAVDLTNPSRGGQTGSSSTSPVAVGGLTNGDSYVFTLTSTDVFGTSAPSAASNTVTPSAIKVAQVGSGPAATHTCAVLSNGTVSCWGNNGNGQLGNGTTTNSTTPVQVKGVGGTGLLSNVSSVAVGTSHTCALLTTGAVDCWGLNGSGQLGNNATTASSTPVQVFAVGSTSSASLLSGVSAIGAGANHNCALLTTGAMDCWGANTSGQVGINSTAAAKTPTQVFAVGSTSSASLLGSVSAIAVGANHNCALLVTGAVDCWGSNSTGQLGNNTTTTAKTPIQVFAVGSTSSASLLSGVTAVTAGSSHSCALLTTGYVNCWGSNTSGQLGNNSTTNAKTPIQVFAVGSTSIASQLVDVASVAAGSANTCAVLISGGVDCWGGNASGQIGNNLTTTATTPVQVFAVGSFTGSSFLASVASVAMGSSYECALLASGTVDCWGYNGNGGLGVNSTTSEYVPTALTVAPSSPVVADVASHASTVSWTAAPTSTYYSTVTATDVTTPANGGESCTATTSSTSCTVRGLTDGDSYTFAVTAFSGIGTSGPSTSSSPTVFVTAPGSPTSLVGTPGNGSVTLSFTAPADHGSAITGYSVTPYDVTTSTSAASQSCSSPGCAIGGLTNGDLYTFTMTASNAAGTSAASLASTAVTPVSSPGAPTNVSGSVDHGRSLISWTPSVSNGSPITSYTASVVGDPTLSCTYVVPVSGPESDECSITGLADATTYAFHVVATNAVGTGPSGTSSSMTTAGTPGAPTITDASADSHHVTLTWTDGATNGAGITSRTVRVYVGASPTPVVVTTDCTGSPCTIAGLGPATSYTFTVTDTNAVGEGSASNLWAISTVSAVPGAPTNVSGTVDHGRSTISWTSPASNGSPITSYTASVVGDPTLSCTYNVPESGPEVDQCLITGLADHTSYQFQVSAASGAEAGATATSSLVTTAGVPDAPTDVTPTPGVARISVAWVDGSSNGSTITSWTIRVYAVGQTPFASKTDCTGSPCVVGGLNNATSYTVVVSASNAVGAGAFSDATAAASTASISDPPVVTATSYGSGSITVAYGQPANDGGTPIWTWTLYCKSPNGGAPRGASTASASTTSLTARGLTPGKSYFCYLYDHNGVGQSVLTRVVLSASPDAAPGFGRQTQTTFIPDAAPSIVAGAKAVRGDGQATVSWSEPAPNGSSAVVSYSVVSTPSVASAASCTNVAAALPRSCVFTGLTNGTSYTFNIVATNVMGSGTVRTVTRVVPAGLPGAPSITSVTSASKQCSVTWSDGAANGSPLLSARKVIWYLGSTLKGIRTVSSGSSLVITGLTDGLSYSFKVANANVVGSTTSSVVTCTPGVPAP